MSPYGTPHVLLSRISSRVDQTSSYLGSSATSQARPKSTPASSQRVGYRNNGSAISRPKTAVFSSQECERLLQVEREPTRAHNLKPHLRIQKSKPSPWQAQLEFERLRAAESNRLLSEGTPKPVHIAPGYMLSRSKSKIQMVINEQMFEHVEKASRAGSAKPVASELEDLVAPLREQVADLSLHLEEERILHRATKRKAEDLLKDQIARLKSDHKEAIRRINDEHTDNLSTVNEGHQEKVKDISDKYDNMIAKLRTEIEFLQGAFESYKSQTNAENQKLWKEKEDELRQGHSHNLEMQLKHQSIKVLNEYSAEKVAIEREHNKSMAQLKKECKKELETMNRRFASHAADLRKLSEAEAKLEENSATIANLQSSYAVSERELSNVKRDFNELRAKMSAFEVNFEKRVQDVDYKYKGQLNDIMEQNTELRRLYIKKCDEVFTVQSERDRKKERELLTTKEAMKKIIESRNRAYVSVAATHDQISPTKPKNRPSSAPSTQTEENSAYRSIGQTDEYVTRHEVPFARPQSVIEMAEVFGQSDLENVTENELKAVMAGQRH